MNLRPYRPEDAAELLALFRDTVRRVNCQDYSPEQIRAWTSDEIDAEAWAKRFEGRFVVVAEKAGRIVGFTELEENGHIDRLYVSADHQRQGIGRVLLGAVAAEAERCGISRLWSEVSITAKPLFEAAGFRVVAPQTVRVRGVDFLNYRMERLLK
jgi:GNAT superfamily N-acetyltransferase